MALLCMPDLFPVLFLQSLYSLFNSKNFFIYLYTQLSTKHCCWYVYWQTLKCWKAGRKNKYNYVYMYIPVYVCFSSFSSQCPQPFAVTSLPHVPMHSALRTFSVRSQNVRVNAIGSSVGRSVGFRQISRRYMYVRIKSAWMHV